MKRFSTFLWLACLTTSTACGGSEAPDMTKVPTALSTCGNGVIDEGEVCDGANFGYNTCESLGLGTDGDLVCASTCLAFSTAGCIEQSDPGDVPGTDDGGGTGGGDPGSGGGDDPDDTDPGNTDPGNTDPGNTDPPAGDCDRNGFVAAAQEAQQDQTNSLFRYTAMTSTTAPFDLMEIQSYQASPYNGPTGPGTYQLDGANYADCGLCVLAWSGCNEQSCEKVYYADAGAVVISSMGGSGTQFDGSLEGLIFREVTIDSETWISTPVSGGETWCVDDYDFDATVGESSSGTGGGTDGGDDGTTSGGSGDGSVDPGDGPAMSGNPGAPCQSDGDCEGNNAECVPDARGFPGGYCSVLECTQKPCLDGSGCFAGDEGEADMCLDYCVDAADCRIGYRCWGTNTPGIGVCYPNGDGGSGEYRCTPDSCPSGYICASSGVCVEQAPDLPSGPIPNCGGVAPAWNDCNPMGGSNSCAQLVSFNPRLGPGYWDYPLNGETEADQYRSYARRDLMLIIKYASALTECMSADWDWGNHQPIGLGDMSEANGAIPGSREGDPGHPEGTHVDGHDMDIGYFQVGTPDNILRSICNHTSGGVDQYHCVDQPDTLDVWRTAMFLGFLHDNPYLRVIGVDGKAGVLVENAIQQLCGAGWLTGNACEADGIKLAYETEDEGQGWYRFHHHHFHVSLSSPPTSGWSNVPPMLSRCLTPSCSTEGVDRQMTLERRTETFRRVPRRIQRN